MESISGKIYDIIAEKTLENIIVYKRRNQIAKSNKNN